MADLIERFAGFTLQFIFVALLLAFWAGVFMGVYTWLAHP